MEMANTWLKRILMTLCMHCCVIKRGYWPHSTRDSHFTSSTVINTIMVTLQLTWLAGAQAVLASLVNQANSNESQITGTLSQPSMIQLQPSLIPAGRDTPCPMGKHITVSHSTRYGTYWSEWMVLSLKIASSQGPRREPILTMVAKCDFSLQKWPTQ